jgi:hypothetical protein
MEIIMAFVISVLIGKDADWLTGLEKGAAIGFGLVALAFGVNYLFEGKSIKLWLINAGYNVVIFSLMGLIIGAM